MNPDDGRSPARDRRVIHDINTRGWHVVQVPPRPPRREWAFSLGLFQTFDHAEIVVFGLPADVSATLIDAVGTRVRSGARFADGDEDGGLMRPYRCAFRAVAEVWRPLVLGDASWFYRERSFPAVQLFWPDRAHRLPWDHAFDPELLEFQPLLFFPEVGPARAASLLVAGGDPPDPSTSGA